MGDWLLAACDEHFGGVRDIWKIAGNDGPFSGGVAELRSSGPFFPVFAEFGDGFELIRPRAHIEQLLG
jgi:hypothetical protein